MLGADDCGFGTTLLVALGCIYARQCHKNTCPVGIATQDPELRKKFKGTPEEAETFFHFIAADVRRRLAALGARSLDEIRGRSDLLRSRARPRASDYDVDLSRSAAPAGALADRATSAAPTSRTSTTCCGAEGDRAPAPADRAVGARHRARHRRAAQRAARTFVPQTRRYVGNAGQSFGAFITDGSTLELDGDANDYVGKGMEGGGIVVRNPGSPTEPVIGNACFYGARGGDGVHANGTAGERLAVRNSGARIVVEGAGAHCCEYMTAGTVAILGPVGRNVASGMTGGEAFFLATETRFADRLGPTELRAAPSPDDAAPRTASKRCSRSTSRRPVSLARPSCWRTGRHGRRFVQLAPGRAGRSRPEPAAVLATSPRFRMPRRRIRRLCAILGHLRRIVARSARPRRARLPSRC